MILASGQGDQSCNWQCYLNRYPDLQNAFGATNVAGAEQHWNSNGKREGRDCTCPGYVKGAEGANACPTGYIHIGSFEECKRAAAAVGAGLHRAPLGSWHWVPPYCSFQSAGDKAVHFNTNRNGSNDGGYTPICKLETMNSSGGQVVIDLLSNGNYWWGGSWVHQPASGDTSSCVCIKGLRADNGVLDAYCYNGIKSPTSGSGFIQGIMDVNKFIPFDGNHPIDITTEGTDALWMDRLRFKTSTASRWYGANNSHGWCLSKDQNDQFDKWATHSGCRQTLSFIPNGKVYGYNSRAGMWNSRWLLDMAANKCASFNGRRRVEGWTPAVPSTGQDFERGSAYLDADPIGESPNQVLNERDALAVGGLHNAIRAMVRENEDVTDGQIDALLNSAMLEAEHIVEREEHEGEVLEPEVGGNSNEQPTAGTGSSKDNRNVQGRLQDLEEQP